MTRVASALWTIGIVAGLAACGGSPAPPVSSVPPKPAAQAPQPAQPAAPATAPVAQAPAPAAESPRPPAVTSPIAQADAALTPPIPNYDSKGRRDPFEPIEVVRGSRGPTVASAKLTGIVRGSGSHWALVETSDGIGYILRPGDELGEGRVVDIQRDSIVFTIAPKPGGGPERVVLSLATR